MHPRRSPRARHRETTALGVSGPALRSTRPNRIRPLRHSSLCRPHALNVPPRHDCHCGGETGSSGSAPASAQRGLGIRGARRGSRWWCRTNRRTSGAVVPATINSMGRTHERTHLGLHLAAGWPGRWKAAAPVARDPVGDSVGCTRDVRRRRIFRVGVERESRILDAERINTTIPVTGSRSESRPKAP
jgi:hypothetical protein